MIFRFTKRSLFGKQACACSGTSVVTSIGMENPLQTLYTINTLPSGKLKRMNPFPLEILLAPHKRKLRVRVLIASTVELIGQRLGPAEEDTGLARGVHASYVLEDGVPVGTTEVCRGAKTRDGVLLGVRVVEHDVCGVVELDWRGEVLSSGGASKTSAIRTVENEYGLLRTREQGGFLRCGSQCGYPGPELPWPAKVT